MIKGLILVVDDDPDFQRLIARAAQAEGFSVVEALDGASGLALALTRPIDLILLDIYLPLLDGRDVLTHLKQDARTAGLPVIVCSGRTDEHSRRLAVDLGAIEYLEKPLNARAVVVKIGHLIEKARTRKASGDADQADASAAGNEARDRRQFAPTSEQATLIGKKVARSRRSPSPLATPVTKRPLRVLLAEDAEEDALLLERELKNAGFAVSLERVQSREAMKAALTGRTFDLVVSDYSMPGFDALDALATVKATGIDLPFIVVSGTVDEASAVIALKAGAHDFVVKGNFARLVPAVERELREAQSRAERRKIEEQLMVSDRMASVGMLAAGVAHEINNPLAAVLGNLSIVCEILEQATLEPRHIRDAAEAAADAMSAAERVGQIVRDVKIFSRGSEERVVPVDIHRVLDSTVRMALNDIRHRARVVRHFGPIQAVMGSEQRLGQVFLNLLVNAAQAIPEGHALENEIRLSTSMDESRVVIDVSDTGSGIDPEVLPRLFTPFVTTKAPGQGTGLGLSISRRIVRALGGELTVESQFGKGATFRVMLPGTDLAPAASDPSRNKEEIVVVGRSRILVVDDEVMVTNAIRRIIGSSHDVVVVFRAQDALDRLRSGERFDLILCDLLMPEMTGIKLHEALSVVAPEQAHRMLFMSGGTFTADAAAFVDARTDRVVEKPFDKPTLMAAISACLSAWGA